MANFNGARPKSTASILENLEQVILKKLCDCGGSLSLTALNESLIEDGVFRKDSSKAALRELLTTRSPHNIRLFHLDEDRRRNDCTVR